MESEEDRGEASEDQEKSVRVTWGDGYVTCHVLRGDLNVSRLIEIMKTAVREDRG